MIMKEITRQRKRYLRRKHTGEVEGEVIDELLLPKRLPHSLRSRIVFLRAGLVAQHIVEGLALRKAGVLQLLCRIEPIVWISCLMFE